MARSTQLISPKQMARAMGVGESSVKRWCDQGLIETVRTAGGHRKLPMNEVLRYVRERGHTLVSPEVLGLPAVSLHAAAGLKHGGTRLADALLAGNEILAQQIVLDLFLARHSLSAICDEVVAAAFHEIGQRWACRQADVYQERRGCETATRILFDLRGMQPPPNEDCRAIGGTVEGDHYSLPTTMAELVLRDCGFAATSLGTSVPVGSLINAIGATSPKIFWLSVSHIAEGLDFIGEFSQLSKACLAADVALVVGGRALSQELRQQMVYSAFCDTMQQLESFARSLSRNWRRSGKRKPGRARN